MNGNQELTADHLSHDYISDSYKYIGKNEVLILSPQEVAAKIWDQWNRCRLLHSQLNNYVDFKINIPE